MVSDGAHCSRRAGPNARMRGNRTSIRIGGAFIRRPDRPGFPAALPGTSCRSRAGRPCIEDRMAPRKPTTKAHAGKGSGVIETRGFPGTHGGSKVGAEVADERLARDSEAGCASLRGTRRQCYRKVDRGSQEVTTRALASDGETLERSPVLRGDGRISRKAAG